MELSHEVRELCDSFYANTVENNEVYIVKWVFPNGEMPDLSLERALKDRTLADETESAARRMLGNCRLHTDEIMLKVLIYYCGYIRKNSDNYWLRFDLNHYYRIIPTFLEKLLALPRETNAQLPSRISRKMAPESVRVPPSFVTTKPAGVGWSMRS